MPGISKSVDAANQRCEKLKYQPKTPYVTEELDTDDVYHTTCELTYKPPKAEHEYERQFKKVEKQIRGVMGHVSHVPTEYNFQGFPRPLSPVKVHAVLSPESKQNKDRLKQSPPNDDKIRKDVQEQEALKKQQKQEQNAYPYQRPKYGKTKSREFGSPTYKWKKNATTSFPVESPPEPHKKSWIGDNPFSSKNQLPCPSISYDLIGDGVVSSKEYFIAKLFDKGNKGHLTDKERDNAINAYKNGIADRYIFSSHGVRKATENDIKSRNGGWMKHDCLSNHSNTRSRLLQKRKESMKSEARIKAMRHFKHVKEQQLPPDIPFVGTLRARQKNQQQQQQQLCQTHSLDTSDTIGTNNDANTIDTDDSNTNNTKHAENSETNGKNECIIKENKYYIDHPSHASRSELFLSRQNELMKSLEKSRMEAENYFMPVAFRKLDYQQKFLAERNKHCSSRTLDHIKSERLREEQEKGRFWEDRTNFETFNARAKERQFWQNAINKNNENNSNKKRRNSEISNELYNRMKYSNKKDETSIPLPFECENDTLKWNRDKRYKSIIKQELVELRNKELKDSGITKIIDTKIKYQKPNYCTKIPWIKPKRENFEQFADKINEKPSNLIVLFGSRKLREDEVGPNEWRKEKLASYLEKYPMYSSFSDDGIFHEPKYLLTNRKKIKRDNVFKDYVTRPKSGGTMYYVPPQSIDVKYQDTRNINTSGTHDRLYTSRINRQHLNDPTQTQDLLIVEEETDANKENRQQGFRQYDQQEQRRTKRSTSFLKNEKMYKHDRVSRASNRTNSIVHRLRMCQSIQENQNNVGASIGTRLPVRTSAFPKSDQFSAPMRPVTSYALTLSPNYRKTPQVC